MSAQSDIGPVLPPRMDVYRFARLIAGMAQSAAEQSGEGPRCDVGRALAIFDDIRDELNQAAARRQYALTLRKAD